jgi:hypothetical protein
VIPSNVDFAITRNYGETAKDKVNELIFKLFVATGFVFVLVLLAFLAFRPAVVVVLVIPVVLLMTIFVAWVTGYTIDRVSLFALIFSIGILVDDAIVVVENIYRRWLEQGSDHPGDLHGHCRVAAHGVRVGDDGALHGADTRTGFGGHAHISVRRVRLYALAGHFSVAEAVDALPREGREAGAQGGGMARGLLSPRPRSADRPQGQT